MPLNLNTVNSYIGQTVNLHLKDGSTIINVHLQRVINRKLAYKAQQEKLCSLNITEISYIDPIRILGEV